MLLFVVEKGVGEGEMLPAEAGAPPGAGAATLLLGVALTDMLDAVGVGLCALTQSTKRGAAANLMAKAMRGSRG